MNTQQLYISPVRSRKDRADFVNLQKKILSNTPHWVPPSRKESLEAFSAKTNPIQQEATIEHFLARDNQGQTLGRVAVTIHNTYVEKYGATAFFGFFDAVNDKQVATALFNAVEIWCRQRGIERILGPFNYTASQEAGLLIHSQQETCSILQQYNPSYYQELISAAELTPCEHMHTYYSNIRQINTERILARSDKLIEQKSLNVRDVDLNRFDAELEMMRRLYNSAFSFHPHHVPLSQSIFSWQASQLAEIVDPSIIRIIEDAFGRPIAFVLMLPDVNQVLRACNYRGRINGKMVLTFKRKLQSVDSAIVMMIGAVPDAPAGLGRILSAQIVAAGNKYPNLHTTWIHESNSLCLAITKPFASVNKTYALFEKRLSL